MKKIAAMLVVLILSLTGIGAVVQAIGGQSTVGSGQNTGPSINWIKLLDQNMVETTTVDPGNGTWFYVQLNVTDVNVLEFEDINISIEFKLGWAASNTVGRPDKYYKFWLNDTDPILGTTMTPETEHPSSVINTDLDGTEYLHATGTGVVTDLDGDTGNYIVNVTMSAVSIAGSGWRAYATVWDRHGASESTCFAVGCGPDPLDFSVNKAIATTYTRPAQFDWSGEAGQQDVEDAFTVYVGGNSPFNVTSNYTGTMTGATTGVSWSAISLEGKLHGYGKKAIPEDTTPVELGQYTSPLGCTAAWTCNQGGYNTTAGGIMYLDFPKPLPVDTYSGLNVNLFINAI